MNVTAFVASVQALHAQKDGAYGTSWKRRGEVLGILANVARKVDRLERLLVVGTGSVGDETVADTAIDLFVYCLKYQAYLADLDNTVAHSLFLGSDVRPPYSDGVAGFEWLLRAGTFPAVASLSDVTSVAAQVISEFDRLAACFLGVTSDRTAPDRLRCVQALTAAVQRLIVHVV